jgi:hypothetical protein
VSETSVGSDLEESLDVLSEFGLEDVGSHLQVLSLLVISLPVEEPPGNSVTLGIVDEIGNSIALSLREFSSPESRVDPQNLANEESKSPSNSLDLIQGKGDGAFSINIGIEDTMDVFEGILCVFDDE